jgi:hypothetical protein
MVDNEDELNAVKSKLGKELKHFNFNDYPYNFIIFWKADFLSESD